MAGKIKELERRQAILERKIMEGKSKTKPFKLPMGINRILKGGMKLNESIVTQYLTQKGDVKFKVCKIISGNIIVVNNKAHN